MTITKIANVLQFTLENNRDTDDFLVQINLNLYI